jgi:hypothetical protein
MTAHEGKGWGSLAFSLPFCINPSCYLLEIHELLRSNEGASWISLGEEEAHGRDDYSDILPV